MVADWEAAYNAQDAQTFISFYSEDVSYTYIAGPRWYVFTREQLLQDLMTSFSSEQFSAQLNDFFVFADGHDAAVQGVYTDEYVDEQPIVTLLEIENSKIVEQYVYIESFLDKETD